MGSAVYQLLKKKKLFIYYATLLLMLQVVSAYYFEQHTWSTKKHPMDYIYFGNDNSLCDMLQASDRSPLEAVEKMICSSIDLVVKRSCVNCLNCNGKNFMLWAIF